MTPSRAYLIVNGIFIQWNMNLTPNSAIYHYRMPISQTIFPSQLIFDGNFILLSYKLQQSDCYEILHMARQLCCRAMCQIL